MGILEAGEQGVANAPASLDLIGVGAALDQRDHDIGRLFCAGQWRKVGAAHVLGIGVFAVAELFAIALDRVERVLPEPCFDRQLRLELRTDGARFQEGFAVEGEHRYHQTQDDRTAWQPKGQIRARTLAVHGLCLLLSAHCVQLCIDPNNQGVWPEWTIICPICR